MKQTKKQDKRYINIPESYTRRQLNALYREIPLKDTTSRMLRKYFNAMANLYGVITLEKAYEIISEQSPTLVSKEEFLAFAEIARHECEDYYILCNEEIYKDGKTGAFLEREIIDSTLFGTDADLYIQVKQSQKDKPYYIPAKKEFLLYDDPFYCDTTPEVAELKSYLLEQFNLTDEQETALFIEILYSSRYPGAGFTDVMKRMNALELKFPTEQDLEEFAELHQAFHNNTRMQCNRGYTPKELAAMYPKESSEPKSLSFGPNIRKSIIEGTINVNELRQSVLTMKMPSEALRFSILKEIYDAEKEAKKNAPKPQKVGRNDPCPCGSGKKYKRCCGRSCLTSAEKNV